MFARRGFASRAQVITRGVAAACIVIASSPALVVARADAPLATATLQCEQVTEPGRVRCVVEATGRVGVAIRWGDVVIAETAERVTPLKGRIGPRDATTREDSVWRWPFAVVARERGESDLRVRARLVVCEGSRCAPLEIEVRAPLRVGPPVAARPPASTRAVALL